MTVEILHNPKCSKSRQTLALLEEKGITPTVRLYLDTPPSATELADILTKLGKAAKDIVRSKEAREEGIDVAALDNAGLTAALSAHPRAIERPIVINGNRAAVGRPPEAVLDIL